MLVPLEIAASSLMLILLLAELGTGFLALRQITRHQANRFHLEQFLSGGLEGRANSAFIGDEGKKIE